MARYIINSAWTGYAGGTEIKDTIQSEVYKYGENAFDTVGSLKEKVGLTAADMTIANGDISASGNKPQTLGTALEGLVGADITINGNFNGGSITTGTGTGTGAASAIVIANDTTRSKTTQLDLTDLMLGAASGATNSFTAEAGTKLNVSGTIGLTSSKLTVNSADVTFGTLNLGDSSALSVTGNSTLKGALGTIGTDAVFSIKLTDENTAGSSKAILQLTGANVSSLSVTVTSDFQLQSTPDIIYLSSANMTAAQFTLSGMDAYSKYDLDGGVYVLRNAAYNTDTIYVNSEWNTQTELFATVSGSNGKHAYGVNAFGVAGKFGYEAAIALAEGTGKAVTVSFADRTTVVRDSISIDGDLTFEGNDLTLKATGDLTVNGKVKIDYAGSLISGAALTIAESASITVDFNGWTDTVAETSYTIIDGNGGDVANWGKINLVGFGDEKTYRTIAYTGVDGLSIVQKKSGAEWQDTGWYLVNNSTSGVLALVKMDMTQYFADYSLNGPAYGEAVSFTDDYGNEKSFSFDINAGGTSLSGAADKAGTVYLKSGEGAVYTAPDAWGTAGAGIIADKKFEVVGSGKASFAEALNIKGGTTTFGKGDAGSILETSMNVSNQASVVINGTVSAPENGTTVLDAATATVNSTGTWNAGDLTLGGTWTDGSNEKVTTLTVDGGKFSSVSVTDTGTALIDLKNGSESEIGKLTLACADTVLNVSGGSAAEVTGTATIGSGVTLNLSGDSTFKAADLDIDGTVNIDWNSTLEFSGSLTCKGRINVSLAGFDAGANSNEKMLMLIKGTTINGIDDSMYGNSMSGSGIIILDELNSNWALIKSGSLFLVNQTLVQNTSVLVSTAATYSGEMTEDNGKTFITDYNRFVTIADVLAESKRLTDLGFDAVSEITLTGGQTHAVTGEVTINNMQLFSTDTEGAATIGDAANASTAEMIYTGTSGIGAGAKITSQVGTTFGTAETASTATITGSYVDAQEISIANGTVTVDDGGHLESLKTITVASGSTLALENGTLKSAGLTNSGTITQSYNATVSMTGKGKLTTGNYTLDLTGIESSSVLDGKSVYFLFDGNDLTSASGTISVSGVTGDSLTIGGNIWTLYNNVGSNSADSNGIKNSVYLLKDLNDYTNLYITGKEETFGTPHTVGDKTYSVGTDAFATLAAAAAKADAKGKDLGTLTFAAGTHVWSASVADDADETLTFVSTGEDAVTISGTMSVGGNITFAENSEFTAVDGIEAADGGVINVNTGASLTGALKVVSGGTLNMDGGAITTSALELNGTIAFNDTASSITITGTIAGTTGKITVANFDKEQMSAVMVIDGNSTTGDLTKYVALTEAQETAGMKAVMRGDDLYVGYAKNNLKLYSTGTSSATIKADGRQLGWDAFTDLGSLIDLANDNSSSTYTVTYADGTSISGSDTAAENCKINFKGDEGAVLKVAGGMTLEDTVFAGKMEIDTLTVNGTLTLTADSRITIKDNGSFTGKTYDFDATGGVADGTYLLVDGYGATANYGTVSDKFEVINNSLYYFQGAKDTTNVYLSDAFSSVDATVAAGVKYIHGDNAANTMQDDWENKTLNIVNGGISGDLDAGTATVKLAEKVTTGDIKAGTLTVTASGAGSSVDNINVTNLEIALGSSNSALLTMNDLSVANLTIKASELTSCVVLSTKNEFNFGAQTVTVKIKIGDADDSLVQFDADGVGKILSTDKYMLSFSANNLGGTDLVLVQKADPKTSLAVNSDWSASMTEKPVLNGKQYTFGVDAFNSLTNLKLVQRNPVSIAFGGSGEYVYSELVDTLSMASGLKTLNFYENTGILIDETVRHNISATNITISGGADNSIILDGSKITLNGESSLVIAANTTVNLTKNQLELLLLAKEVDLGTNVVFKLDSSADLTEAEWDALKNNGHFASLTDGEKKKLFDLSEATQTVTGNITDEFELVGKVTNLAGTEGNNSLNVTAKAGEDTGVLNLTGVNYDMQGGKNTVSLAAGTSLNIGNLTNVTTVTVAAGKTSETNSTANFGDIKTSGGTGTINVGKYADFTASSIGKAPGQGGTNNITFGDGTTATISGAVNNVNNLTIGSSLYDKEGNSISDSEFSAHSISAPNTNGKVTIGSNAEVFIGQKDGNGEVLNYGEVDLGGGKNTVAVGANTTFESGTVSGVSTLDIKAGTKVAGEQKSTEMTINGDYNAAAVANSVTIGNYSNLTITGSIDNGGLDSETGTNISIKANARMVIEGTTGKKDDTANGTMGIVADGISGLTLAAGTAYKPYADSSSLQGTTYFTVKGSVTGTSAKNTFTTANFTEVDIQGALNLYGGNNAVTVGGVEAVFKVAGEAKGIQSLSVKDGKVLTVTTGVETEAGMLFNEIQRAVVTIGGDLMGTSGTNNYSFGKFSQVSIGGSIASPALKGNYKITVGSNAEVFIGGSVADVVSLTVNAGAVTKFTRSDDGVTKYTVSEQGYTLFEAGVISGTAANNTFKFGKFSKVSTSLISMGGGNDSLIADANSFISVGAVEFGSGNDTLTIGAYAGEVLKDASGNVTSISRSTVDNVDMGEGAKNTVNLGGAAAYITVGDISGVNKLDIKAGKIADTKTGTTNEINDVMAGNVSSSDIDTEAFKVAVNAGEKISAVNDTVTIGAYSNVTIGSMELGIGKNTVTLGGQAANIEVNGMIDGINKLDIKAGAAGAFKDGTEKFNNVTINGNVSAADQVSGLGTADDPVIVDAIADTVTIGAYSNVEINGYVNLGIGTNSVTLGGKAANIAVTGENTAGYSFTGVNKFTVTAGATGTFAAGEENVYDNISRVTIAGGICGADYTGRVWNKKTKEYDSKEFVTNDTVTIGGFTDVTISGDIDLGEGNNSVTLGGTASSIKLANLTGVNSLKISSGGKANVLKNFVMMDSVTGNANDNKFTFDANSFVMIDNLDFGGKSKSGNTMTTTNTTTLVITGTITGLEDGKSAINKDTQIFASDEAKAALEAACSGSAKPEIKSLAEFTYLQNWDDTDAQIVTDPNNGWLGTMDGFGTFGTDGTDVLTDTVDILNLEDSEKTYTKLLGDSSVMKVTGVTAGGETVDLGYNSKYNRWDIGGYASIKVELNDDAADKAYGYKLLA